MRKKLQTVTSNFCKPDTLGMSGVKNNFYDTVKIPSGKASKLFMNSDQKKFELFILFLQNQGTKY